MKVELSIQANYFPEWGVWEGVRELVANARDAEREFSAPLTVRHRKEGGVLILENEGATLPHEALLLGFTTKQGQSEMIGRFGEGLKGGVLALVRAGLAVKIRSGSEVWTPSIQRSEKFNANVLVFDIEKGRKEQDRVAVEIGSVTVEAWEKFRQLFLFLAKDSEQIVKTSSGSLLLAEEHKGRIFVKGIFVGNDPKMAYGYDLYHAQLDRDRKMVEKYDLQYRTQAIWSSAMRVRPDLIEPFGKMLDEQAADVEGIGEYTARTLSDDVKKSIVDTFQKRHGEEALPVDSLAVSQEVEHLGKRGIICTKPMQHILESILGNAATNKAKLAEETLHLYGWHDLSDVERANLIDAIATIHPVEPVAIDEVNIADFRDVRIRGLFKDGKIRLAKKILADRSTALRVLVHEVAHRAGGDGEKGHVSNIERIWSGVVERLRSELR